MVVAGHLRHAVRERADILPNRARHPDCVRSSDIKLARIVSGQSLVRPKSHTTLPSSSLHSSNFLYPYRTCCLSFSFFVLMASNGSPITNGDSPQSNGLTANDQAQGRVAVHSFNPDASPSEKGAAAGKGRDQLKSANAQPGAGEKGPFSHVFFQYSLLNTLPFFRGSNRYWSLQRRAHYRRRRH